MRRIAWLGVIFAVLLVLSLFLPQYPDVARAAPGTESLWSESNSVSDPGELTLTDTGNANGSTNSTWADANGEWTSPYLEWWEFVMQDSAVGEGPINSVTLYLKHCQSGWVDDSFSIEIYDGTTWLEVQAYINGSGPPESDTTNNWDVKTLGIDTWTKINAAKVRIIGELKVKGEDIVQWFVYTVELRIDYTPQVISITLTDATPDGIHFGSLNPGTSDNPDLDQTEATPSIGMNVEPETNINVDLQIKGTDFSGTFTAGNAKYSLTFGGAKYTLSTTYATFAENVAPGGQQDLWHWLNVPGGTTAGNYESIFSYKAIEYTGG